MSPSHSRHSPPALSDDDIVSVFLRIPPDDPARLVRASLVCKAWRRILTSPDFCRLYRQFHRTPPLLGCVVTSWSLLEMDYGGLEYDSRFIPTTAFRLSADPDFDSHNWQVVGSRHGRILVELVDEHANCTGAYFVWDPITNGRWGVPSPKISFEFWAATVLCAKEHCDHLGCHGPPFLVATVASNKGTMSACVYSSESGVWSDIITLKHLDYIDPYGRSILVGDTLHFPFVGSYRVLQYKLSEQKLSVIDVPDKDWGNEILVFISAEDDVLVFAGLRGTRLSLWSAETGALAWAQSKVIELEKLLPPSAFKPKIDVVDDDDEDKNKPYVSAFAEDTVFLSTLAGLFTVELNSGQTKKVAEVERTYNVIPWTSFYTLEHARRMMPRP